MLSVLTSVRWQGTLLRTVGSQPRLINKTPICTSLERKPFSTVDSARRAKGQVFSVQHNPSYFLQQKEDSLAEPLSERVGEIVA